MYAHTLRSGRIILLDDEDEHYLRHYNINTMKTSHGYTRYVVCTDFVTKKYIGLLHRIILKVTSDNIEVDHINGNGLDCQKDNLRQATVSLNQQNRRIQINNYSGAKGVYYRKDRGYWTARITINNSVIHLGHFFNKKDAIKARLEAEPIYHPYTGHGTEQVS